MREQQKTGREKRLNKVPPARGPKIKVRRLRGHESVSGIVLSDNLWGFEIHYNPAIKRSEPHFEEPHLCDGCGNKLPLKSVFYLHLLETPGAQLFLELSPGGARSFQDALGEMKSYRGTKIKVRRTPADNGRLIVEIDPYFDARGRLPQSVDPIDTLRILWSWNRK